MALNFSRLEEITRALKLGAQTGKSFHTTFVYRGNKMLCLATNNYNKLHRRHKFTDYTKNDCDNYVASLHSEISSLIRLGFTDCSDLSFVNIRIDNNDCAAVSRPCENCARVLLGVGYKNLWYYDGSKYIKEKFKS